MIDNSTCREKYNKDRFLWCNVSIWMSDLLFGPELIKHLLDLHPPVVLHAVEGVLRHGGHHRLLDGRQLLQDAGEGGTHVGVLVPAFWTQTMQ